MKKILSIIVISLFSFTLGALWKTHMNKEIRCTVEYSQEIAERYRRMVEIFYILNMEVRVTETNEEIVPMFGNALAGPKLLCDELVIQNKLAAQGVLAEMFGNSDEQVVHNLYRLSCHALQLYFVSIGSHEHDCPKFPELQQTLSQFEDRMRNDITYTKGTLLDKEIQNMRRANREQRLHQDGGGCHNFDMGIQSEENDGAGL